MQRFIIKKDEKIEHFIIRLISPHCLKIIQLSPPSIFPNPLFDSSTEKEKFYYYLNTKSSKYYSSQKKE